MQRVDVVYALIHDSEKDKILMVHNIEQNVGHCRVGLLKQVKH